MTTLIAFAGVDNAGPSALYIASESRISWGKQHAWDGGRKIFASTRYAHVFGYSGDVVFPSHVLSQLVELIDLGALQLSDVSTDEAHQIIVAAIQKSFELRQNSPTESFDILHAMRADNGKISFFALWKLSFNKSSSTWTDEPITINANKSSLVVTLGSGSEYMRLAERAWSNSAQGGTTRSIYSAFNDALLQGNDAFSGGAPQLVGMYRRGPAKSIGVIYGDRRYLSGLPVPDSAAHEKLEWRDKLFQRIDGTTLTVEEGAQRHARPKM